MTIGTIPKETIREILESLQRHSSPECFYERFLFFVSAEIVGNRDFDRENKESREKYGLPIRKNATHVTFRVNDRFYNIYIRNSVSSNLRRILRYELKKIIEHPEKVIAA